jgi:hypothetical protein
MELINSAQSSCLQLETDLTFAVSITPDTMGKFMSSKHAQMQKLLIDFLLYLFHVNISTVH